jgi:hypothetical protein
MTAPLPSRQAPQPRGVSHLRQAAPLRPDYDPAEYAGGGETYEQAVWDPDDVLWLELADAGAAAKVQVGMVYASDGCPLMILRERLDSPDAMHLALSPPEMVAVARGVLQQDVLLTKLVAVGMRAHHGHD